MSDTNKTSTVTIEVPTLENLSKRRSLIPLFFSLTIVFFFLNFMTLSCGNQKIATISGINLVTGKEIKDHDVMNGKEFTTGKIPANKWAIISFSLAIIGLGVFLLKEKNENKIGLFSGAVGAISLLILQYSINNDLGKREMENVQTSLHFPYWGAVLSMSGAALLCYLRNKKTPLPEPSINETLNKEEAAPSIVTADIKSPAVKKTSDSFDIINLISKHKYKVLLAFLIFATGYAVYYFFLKANPGADAKSLFNKQCDCIEEGNQATIAVYKDFLVTLELKKFATREEARNKLQALLDSSAVINYNCEVQRNEDYAALKEKYNKDKENLRTFEAEYQKVQAIGCASKNNSELNAIINKTEETISLIKEPTSSGIHISDATEFFISFKNTIIGQWKDNIIHYVSFPFNEQGSYLNQAEFIQNFTLSDEMIRLVSVAQAPVMIDENRFTIPGTGMGFSKHGDGFWKWDDIYYGE